MPRGPRIKVYEENELFEAASYIRTLEGDRPHDERENVFKQIKKIFTLRRAEVASKSATLTFWKPFSTTSIEAVGRLP